MKEGETMIIEVEGVTKVYDNRIKALDGVDLKIKEGEVFGLLGPNGAGKTTLIHILSTLIKPTSGVARVNGYDVIKNPDRVRKSIGIVFQDPSSDDLLTGYENLKLHALMFGVPKYKREERIKELLNLVEMGDRANDLVRKYSGGMRRRLELARGLLHEPKVLFLDEPTLGLDPQSREHVWNYIEGLMEEKDISILITTHYMEEADRLCDRVAIIDLGKIVVLNTPKKLKAMVGGDVVMIKARNVDMKKFELDYVKRIEKKGDCLYLTVSNSGEHLQEILNLAGEVESVELRTPTLNDVFIHYTGKEIREGSPEGGYMERMVQVRARG